MAANDETRGLTTSVQVEYAAALPKFANAVQCKGAQDHFAFDFLFFQPELSLLVSRIILTPEHTKRLRDVLIHQIKSHEDRFGPIANTKSAVAEMIKLNRTTQRGGRVKKRRGKTQP